jgi:hypothetical protein
MSEEFSIGLSKMEEIMKDTHIIVDIRGSSFGSENRIRQAFTIHEFELPYDIDEVPEMFKTTPTVIISSDGESAKRWVNMYTEQDDSIQVYYYEGGAEKFKDDFPSLIY